MYKLIGEAVQLVIDLKPRVVNSNHCEIIVAPPFTAIKIVADRLEGSNIKVSAQDVAPEAKQGAFTGEVSADMLRDAGATHVIIGHSERRQFFGETDELVNRKIKAAMQHGLTPIVCVGETLTERDDGRQESVVKTQIAAGLASLTAQDVSRIIIAYEPVWAIGTGRTATPQVAQTMHAFIRKLLADLVGQPTADGVRILYGGSVKPDNIAALMDEPDIDGALVGGASLDAGSFSEIVNYKK